MMLNLLKFPDKIMIAKTGDKFFVKSKTFIFESTGTECFLTTDGEGEWSEEDTYPWKHVRHLETGSAVFSRKDLVETLISGNFTIK